MPSGYGRELHSGRLLHDLTGGLLMERGTAALDAYQAEREAESLREERDRLDAACDELGRRLSVIVRGNSRRTKLLRKALAVEDQIGVGLDGMIESLLAVVASVPTLRSRAKVAERRADTAVDALIGISLGSMNSMTSMSDLGAQARRALETIRAKPAFGEEG